VNFVPSKRLLWAVFAAALVAVLAGPLEFLRPLWLLSLAGVGLWALADLALSLSAWSMPKAKVAELLRFTKDRPGSMTVTFTKTERAALRVRLGIGLPAGWESQVLERWVDLPEGEGASRIEWPCTPRHRGRYEGVLVCCEVDSRLGCWRLRSRERLATELRVYPNLFSEKKSLAAIFLPRSQFGARLRSMVGRGREFEKLREYMPGDGYDEIHWKATAKRGIPITKVFQAERTQEVYVLIDASRLSARSLTHEGQVTTTLERYITSALVMLLAATRQGDRFGLVVYDDRVRLFLRAKNGASHYAACRDAVHAITPSPVSPDMGELVRHIRASLRNRALLFFLSDLTDPVLAEDCVKHLPVLARQHLVMLNQVRPVGVARLFSGSEVGDEDEIYERLAGHDRWNEARALGLRLKPLGVTANMLENENLAAQLVTQYLRIKERQAL
jgi:uncharacterized protein (DUF58 family)